MQPNYCYKAFIKRVIDGDSVVAIISLGFNILVEEKLRLADIDAPETYGVKKESEEYQKGILAKERLQELVENKDVVIRTSKTGKYGRYIAEIFIEDDQVVNQMLLEEGLVEPYK